MLLLHCLGPFRVKPSGSIAGKPISQLIEFITGVSLYFHPYDGFAMAGFIEALLQIDVFHGLAIGSFPAFSLPSRKPSLEVVEDIVAVRSDDDRRLGL